MSIEEVGCCGAYCGTCRVYAGGKCCGCKIGYANGGRDLSKAKCKIKVCCMMKALNSCADCNEYGVCSVIQDFYAYKGYKYGKYRQATNYIRENGYEDFLEIADKWTNAYGKY